ncbi:hypothetical protein KA107_00930 [Candidatus Pacearchaeota archaeon]|nr:hypothetical protein [Candidatus Pacearchaeota archaeon]
MEKYATYESSHDPDLDSWTLKSFKTTLTDSKGSTNLLWSGRIGTGLFGLTSCSEGNRGPRKRGEVLIAPGRRGLHELVLWGFIPCPACIKPEYHNKIWGTAREEVERRYNLHSYREFADKTKVPFDARRLAWENIVEITLDMPERVYLPRGLDRKEVVHFSDRLKDIIEDQCLEKKLPSLGFYDHTVPSHFTEYALT